MARKRRKGFDVRDFWPWYERSWPTSEWQAQPPPFTLSDLSKEKPAKSGSKWLLIPCLVGAVLMLVWVVWGLFH